MERKKYILMAIFVLYSFSLSAQNNKLVYKAFAEGSMNKWKYSMDSIDALKLKTNKEVLDIINLQYGYIAWCMSNKNSIEAEKHLKKALDNLDKLELKKYNLSELYAYKAAFIGFEIGLSPYKAPFIGPKSLDYAEKSVSINPSNTLGYIQLGNIAYYTPTILGGSKYEALDHYLKALKLMEQNNDVKTHNWNYLNLLATLINVYIDLEQFDTAKKYCLKTLEVEPNFNWVKKNLYPQVLNKLQQ